MGIMNLAEIMDKSIDALKKHIKTLVTFCLVYGLILIISYFAFILIATIFCFIAIKASNGQMVLWIVISLAAILIYTVTLSYSAGIARITSQDVLNERISFEDGIKLSFKSIPKMLGIAAISIIGFLPIIGIFAGIIYLTYGGFNNAAFLIEYDKMYIIIGIVILIAAFFAYFSYHTILSFSIYGVIIENKGPLVSIKHSWQLVKNNFWRIFGSLLLFSITVFLFRSTIQSFFVMLISLLYLLLKFLKAAPDFMVFISMFSSILNWPLSIFTALVITPIGTIMTTFLYFNQRFKKEGYDLTLRLREIEKNERTKVSNAFKYNNSNPTGI